MSDERRRAERAYVKLDANWEGVLARHEGLVVDVSLTGCFILTPDRVTTGELLRLEIRTAAHESIYLWGEVVYQISEMGFAVRFTHLSDDEHRPLAFVIHQARLAERRRETASPAVA